MGKTLTWKDYIEAACPENKIWADADYSCVKLMPGRGVDGNITDVYELSSETDQHAAILGLDGKARNSFLHSIILSLCLRYSPKNLQLFMIDSDEHEFVRYMGYDSSRCVLPHAKNCVTFGTPGSYLTVIETIRDIVQDRLEAFEIMDAYDVAKYNEKVRKHIGATKPDRFDRLKTLINGRYNFLWSAEDCMPHIVLIINGMESFMARFDRKTLPAVETAFKAIIDSADVTGVHMISFAKDYNPKWLGGIIQGMSNRYVIGKKVASECWFLGKGTPDSELRDSMTATVVTSLDRTNKNMKYYTIPTVTDKQISMAIRDITSRSY